MLSTVHDHGGVRIAYDRRQGDMPMIVLHGRSGRRQQTAALLAFLPQVCDVAVLPGVSHGLHVQDPAAVAAVINPFIERLAARR